MKKIFCLLCMLIGSIIIPEILRAQCQSIDNYWNAYFNGTFTGRDIFFDIKVSSSSGNVYVTGQTSSGAGADLDYLTIKYNSEGTAVWVRKYNGPRSSNDIAHSIAIDDSENVYVTGESLGLSGDGSDYATIKYDSAGNQIWLDRYNGTSTNADYAYSVFVDASHNAYVTGSGRESGGHGQDIVTIKYSSGGSRIWVAKFDYGLNDYGTKVISDNSGNVYVTGQGNGSGNSRDYITLKYNSAGVLQWSRTFDYLSHLADDPSDIAVDQLGNVIVTGTSDGFVGLQYSTIKYSPAGDSLWYANYFFTGQGNEAKAIFIDSSNYIYITGYSTNNVSGSTKDYLTIKYNPNGTTNASWTKRFDGTLSGGDIATCIVPSRQGTIFVGGVSRDTAGYTDDFVIVEYEMSTMNQCTVNRQLITGDQNINAMGMDYTRGILYACGETTSGTGVGDGMLSRYCITGPVTLVYNVNAAIEGFYNDGSNKLSIRDTVRGYLRNNFSPYALIDSATAVLDSVTLSMTFLFDNMLSGTYYLILKHRNSLETWSRYPGETFACGNGLSYDFTDAANKAFGNNLKQVDTSPVRFADYSGDIDQEGNIDLSDIVLTYNAGVNFASGYVVTDVTGDYFSDLSDLIIVYNNASLFVSVNAP